MRSLNDASFELMTRVLVNHHRDGITCIINLGWKKVNESGLCLQCPLLGQGCNWKSMNSVTV